MWDADVLTHTKNGTIEPERPTKVGPHPSKKPLGLTVPYVRRQHPERCLFYQGRPARRLGHDTVEPELPQVDRLHEGVDHADRVVLVDPVIQAFGK